MPALPYFSYTKPYLWTVLAALSMIVLMATNVSPPQTEAMETDPTNDWRRCTTNADCTVITGYCAWEPVNTQHAEALRNHIVAKYQLDVKLYKCPDEFVNSTKPATQCVEGRCILMEN